MIYINYYCTDFMFLGAMVCVTYSSTILSLIIFNFPLVFKTPIFTYTRNQTILYIVLEVFRHTADSYTTPETDSFQSTCT